MEAPAPSTDPLARFAERQGFLVLDGGLATELEALGCDLDDPLWSARVLLDDPEPVREAHRRFLEAGADCIATATYQASYPGLRARGLDDSDIEQLLREAVASALRVRDEFWDDPTNREGRLRPLVAASIGPYGAFLADGSEYRGDYGLGAEELYEFHLRRWHDLADAGADLIACETTPTRVEAGVYARLAAESGAPAWVSFQCRDGSRLADGDSFEAAARELDDASGIVAVGINCTHPRFISALVAAGRRATSKPILVYPNSGEEWDAAAKAWKGLPAADAAEARAVEWLSAGAFGIGGCCRVGPAVIRAMRRSLRCS